MNLKFFWQSDLLFKETELFQKILKLIKLYHCGQIVFYNLNYFNEVDRLIENRFFPLTEENQRSDSFNNLSPFDIENIENEEEIIWLDKNFAVDKIRYFIGGHIISRLKVLRFFKYFNSIKENRAENLVEAILEQSQFFEFEKELIVEELSHLIRKKDC